MLGNYNNMGFVEMSDMMPTVIVFPEKLGQGQEKVLSYS
jgi:hypothetical protein